MSINNDIGTIERKRLIKKCFEFQKITTDEIKDKIHYFELKYSRGLHDNASTLVRHSDVDFLEESLRKAVDELRLLTYLTSVSDKIYNNVEPGCVVTVGSKRFFVAAKTNPFRLGRKKFTGLSTRSPLFQAMRGKQAGDRFQYQGSTYTIRNIV